MIRFSIVLAAALLPPAMRAQSAEGSPGDGAAVAVAAGPGVSDTAPRRDSTLAAAEAALVRGLPWRATAMLAPVVDDSARRTPEAVFLAATAASRWRGWSEVRGLLGAQEWLDVRFGGEGRRLLAHAVLELGDDSAAARHAALAVTAAAEPALRGAALVLHGQALERLDALDSAAASYIRAAQLLPEVGDWLRLRAAGLTTDSAGRQALYGSLTNPAARARIGRAEAQLRERIGDLLGAASRQSGPGARPAALRLRIAAADSAGRDSLRAEAVALLASGSADEQRRAVALLDSVYAPLTPAEALAVARAAAASGLLQRAPPAFEQAFAAGLGDADDRFVHATALFRLAQYPEAARVFARVPAKHPRGGEAAYQRARAILRSGDEPQAVAALKSVLKRFPRDSAAGAPALVLLADLAADARRDPEARRYQLRLARQFPASRFTPTARLHAALIALLDGRAEAAARELDSLAQGRSAGGEALAAQYWSGRAWAEAGDPARANARWESIIGRDPASYYAGLAARRLGAPLWEPPEAADSFAPVPAVDSGLDRALALERLGLTEEAAVERDQAAGAADETLEGLLATASAFRSRGYASQATRLASRAIARGARADARVYRLLYPVTHADALRAEAGAQGLDPAFVAALIRQESLFNPAATSSAGARGLMQLMPATGGTLARSLGFPTWNPVLLWQPDVSLAMGTIHLKELAARYDHPVRTLAAYNAGVHRVIRWDGKLGMGDPELFAERIPFVETRDYVRIIQRNRDLYRALYDWGEEAAP
ncbi:MAG TPA: transglycosylase SLT domain-containing protein [Gemmatimonadales bacterium]|nr:transglycosylase SLT domain-containing protein [Gemmatimonadales bacterium]